MGGMLTKDGPNRGWSQDAGRGLRRRQAKRASARAGRDRRREPVQARQGRPDRHLDIRQPCGARGADRPPRQDPRHPRRHRRAGRLAALTKCAETGEGNLLDLSVKAIRLRAAVGEDVATRWRRSSAVRFRANHASRFRRLWNRRGRTGRLEDPQEYDIEAFIAERRPRPRDDHTSKALSPGRPTQRQVVATAPRRTSVSTSTSAARTGGSRAPGHRERRPCDSAAPALAAGHKTLVPAVIERLKGRGAEDIIVFRRWRDPGLGLLHAGPARQGIFGPSADPACAKLIRAAPKATKVDRHEGKSANDPRFLLPFGRATQIFQTDQRAAPIVEAGNRPAPFVKGGNRRTDARYKTDSCSDIHPAHLKPIRWSLACCAHRQRVLAGAITLIESQRQDRQARAERCWRRCCRMHRRGDARRDLRAPGRGQFTFRGLGSPHRAPGRRAAVLAVDPSVIGLRRLHPRRQDAHGEAVHGPAALHPPSRLGRAASAAWPRAHVDHAGVRSGRLRPGDRRDRRRRRSETAVAGMTDTSCCCSLPERRRRPAGDQRASSKLADRYRRLQQGPTSTRRRPPWQPRGALQPCNAASRPAADWSAVTALRRCVARASG